MECPVVCVLCFVSCVLYPVSYVEHKSGAWSGSEGESWEGLLLKKRE